MSQLQREAQNVTDVIPPLNCSEIINNVGNPTVARIIWTVTSKSECVGMPTGSVHKLYTFNPSDNLRNCNNANITCRATNEVGFTTKMYTMIFNCEFLYDAIMLMEIIRRVLAVPGIPRKLQQGQPTPLANGIIIAWQAPIDDGGFIIIGYKYDVIDKTGSMILSANVPSTTTSARISDLGVAESYNFTVSAVNVLGRSSPFTISFISPDGKLLVL